MSSRKPLLILCLALILCIGMTITSYGAASIKIYLDNKQLSFSYAQPFLDNSNRTQVPLRVISENLGATIGWNQDTKEITITKGEDILILTVGKYTMAKNGKLISMDTAPVLVNSSAMVPLRFVSENLGVAVEWIAAESKVIIRTGLDPGNISSESSARKFFPKPFESGYFSGIDQAEVLGETFGVTFSANREVAFLTPYDPNINRTILVENKGANTVLIEWNINSDSLGLASDDMMSHPQPAYLLLKPGEKQAILACYQYLPNNIQTGDASFNVKIKATNKSDNNKMHDVSFILKNSVTAYGMGNQHPPNATISGIITDSKTGTPQKNVVVFITDGLMRQAITTDVSGRYSFALFAYQNVRGYINEYAITVNQGQNSLMYDTLSISKENTNSNDLYAYYGQKRAAITPKPDDKITMDFQLEKKPASLQYSVDKVIDTVVQQYAFDASDDGSVIASIPFHTGLSDSEREKNAFLNVFNYKGDILFKAYIGDETPAIDVSKDGSLIATTIKEKASDMFSCAIVFDKQGNKYYQSQVIEHTTVGGNVEKSLIREVQISDDNKYLMISDVNGMIWMVDMATGKTVWSVSTGTGQVRKIKFDLNDTVIYVSSGDGYLRCYTIMGDLKWETYVDAWTPDMEVSKNFIVTMSKASPCYIHVINKLTGETIQTIPVTSGGSHISISPDESLIWYGESAAGGKSTLSSNIYDFNGNIKYNFCTSDQEVVFSGDSQYFAAKNGVAVAVLNRDGQILWQQALAKNGTGDSVSTVLWMSPDGKYIVAGLNDDPSYRFWGQLYFLSRK